MRVPIKVPLQEYLTVHHIPLVLFVCLFYQQVFEQGSQGISTKYFTVLVQQKLSKVKHFCSTTLLFFCLFVFLLGLCMLAPTLHY